MEQDLQTQNAILESMSNTILKTQVYGKTTMMPFQKGFVQSIAAVFIATCSHDMTQNI
jgi:hypothetical protein